MEKRIKNIILGAGPAGYCAAIRLGQLGQECLVIEKKRMGGTCLNVGCIPSKALIHAATQYKNITKESAIFGIRVKEASIDWSQTIHWKNNLTTRITQGVEFLLKKNNVEFIYGVGELLSNNQVQVTNEKEENTIITAENILLATGSSVIELPNFPFDHQKIVDSADLLDMKQLPESIILLGGGIIGCELGNIYAMLGVKVIIVEMLARILMPFEKEAAQIVAKKMQSLGVEIHSATTALAYEEKNGKIILTCEKNSEKIKLTADILGVAVGRKPNINQLNLSKINIIQEKGKIAINDKFQTSIPNIYAIGDLVAGPMLAHKASAEAIMVAEIIAGKQKSREDSKAIANVVYTKPEIASVGISEQEAQAANIEVITGKFPLAALGRSATVGETQGYVKYISCKESHRIIGVVIVANLASELIGQATLAIEMRASLEDVAMTIQAHPSFSEAHLEAAAASLGEAIHIVNK